MIYNDEHILIPEYEILCPSHYQDYVFIGPRANILPESHRREAVMPPRCGPKKTFPISKFGVASRQKDFWPPT